MLILHVIAGLEAGGAENMLLRLIRNSESNRHVVVSLTTFGSLGKILESAGYEVHALYLEKKKILTWL